MSDNVEPAQVVQSFIFAVNTGDAGAGADLCTEDVRIATPDGDVLTGRAGAHQFIAALAGRHVHLQLRSYGEQGDEVTGTMEMTGYHGETGAVPLDIALTATVRDGKLASFDGPFTPEAREK